MTYSEKLELSIRIRNTRWIYVPDPHYQEAIDDLLLMSDNAFCSIALINKWLSKYDIYFLPHIDIHYLFDKKENTIASCADFNQFYIDLLKLVDYYSYKAISIQALAEFDSMDIEAWKAKYYNSFDYLFRLVHRFCKLYCDEIDEDFDGIYDIDFNSDNLYINKISSIFPVRFKLVYSDFEEIFRFITFYYKHFLNQ